MAYPKFKSVVQECIVKLGQVAGTSVQTYTEPQAKLAVNRAFDFLWDKHKWDQLWRWQTATLDGVNGRINADITGVRYATDIGDVITHAGHRSIPFPSSNEHLEMDAGSDPLFRTILPWDDTYAEKRFFKFWPPTATGQVDMHIGFRPDAFVGDEDVIPMDRNLIVDGAVWQLLVDDGTNPASATKAQTLFDTTFQDIMARVGAKQFGHGAGHRNGSTVIIR